YESAGPAHRTAVPVRARRQSQDRSGARAHASIIAGPSSRPRPSVTALPRGPGRAAVRLLLSGVPVISGGRGASVLSDRLRSDAGARAALLERRAISPRALRAARRRRHHGVSV